MTLNTRLMGSRIHSRNPIFSSPEYLMDQLEIITTGGTIEKLYDESNGTLVNQRSIISRMLAELRLENLTVHITELMSKDSLEITVEDRLKIVETVRERLSQNTSDNLKGIVILHGTDTLCNTGELITASIQDLGVPVVLTGAMRPFEMRKSDALQNLTEAIFASRLLSAGVYCVAHGQVHAFPGIVKDKSRGTFVRSSKSPG